MGALALTRENALAAHRGDRALDRSTTFYDVRRTFYVRDRSIVERPQNVRRTSQNAAVVRRRPRDRVAAGRRRGTTPSTAASTSRRRSSARTSTSATTRTPTAPTPRSGSAAARRSSSGSTRRRSRKKPSAARSRRPRCRASGPAARLDFITSQPVAWLKLTGRKILLLFNRTEMLDTESQESYAEFSTPLRVLGWVGHFGLLVPLAVLGVIATWPDRRRLWLVLCAGAHLRRQRRDVLRVRALSVSAGAVPDAVCGRTLRLTCSRVRSRARSLRVRVDGSSRPSLVAVAIFANWPLLSSTLMMAITENNLGTALHGTGALRRGDRAPRARDRAACPTTRPAYNNLGAALRAAGRLDEAVARYQQALELKPDFASASYNLANALLEQGKAGDSVGRASAASLAANRRTPSRRTTISASRSRTGATRPARSPNSAPRWRSTIARCTRIAISATCCSTPGSAPRAWRISSAPWQLAPSEPEAVYDIGTILLQDQNFAGAAARFEAALKIRPDWAEAHNNLGIALASQGRIAEALTHFERAVALKPTIDRRPRQSRSGPRRARNVTATADALNCNRRLSTC